MVILALIGLLLLTFPYVFGGLRIMLGKFKYKSNTGLVFLRSKSGNFPMPYPCDLTSSKFTIKLAKAEHTFPITREMFRESGNFFGLPFIMFDVEDAKNTIGLYYQQSDEQGEPLLDGRTNEPYLSKVKPAVTLPPSIIKALIGEQALTQALKELFEKNQILLYILIGNIIVSGIAVFLLYEYTSTTVPNIENQLQTIIGLVGTN